MPKSSGAAGTGLFGRSRQSGLIADRFAPRRCMDAEILDVAGARHRESRMPAVPGQTRWRFMATNKNVCAMLRTLESPSQMLPG